MRFTAEEVVQILAGSKYDEVSKKINKEKRKVAEKYRELKSTPRWFSPEELRDTAVGNRNPEGAMLVPGFTEASLKSKAWWLQKNLPNAFDTSKEN